MRYKVNQTQLKAYKQIIDLIVSYTESDTIQHIYQETGISNNILNKIKNYRRKNLEDRNSSIRESTVGAILILLWYYNINLKDILNSVMFDTPYFYNMNQYYVQRASRWYTELLEYRKSNNTSVLNRVIAEMAMSIKDNPVHNHGGEDGPVQRVHDTGN